MACRRIAVLIAVVFALAPSALAQPLGTFRWQIQPYCNVLTVNVTQHGGIYTLDGTDDRCAAERAASVVGIAFLNLDGTVGFGMTTVVPGGTPIHVDATINISSLSGTWRDSAGNAGDFVFTPKAGTGGTSRLVPSSGLPPGSVTAAQLAPGAVGATHLAANSVSGGHVVDGSLTSADLAAGSITWSGLSGVPAGFVDGVDDIGWSLSGNAGTSSAAFLGTTDGAAFTFKVNGTTALRLAPTSGTPNVIGGFSGNLVDAGLQGATIAGGGNSGELNSAWGDFGVVGGGRGNLARGYSTVAGGLRNHAWGDFAVVGGGSDSRAMALFSTVPGGWKAWARHYGEMAYASGSFDLEGDAQTSVYVLRNTTTDATQTELFLDGQGARLTLADGRALSFEMLVVGRTAGGETAGYRIFGTIRNVGGTTTMVGASGSVLGETAGALAWDAIAAADDTNDALVIRVTGAASTTIRWVGTVRTAEVTFW